MQLALPKKTIFIALFAILAFSMPFTAQAKDTEQNSATVKGTIKTPEGAPLENSFVILEKKGEKDARKYTGMTDEKGQYHFENMPQGEYEIYPIEQMEKPDKTEVTVEKQKIVIEDIVVDRKPKTSSDSTPMTGVDNAPGEPSATER